MQHNDKTVNATIAKCAVNFQPPLLAHSRRTRECSSALIVRPIFPSGGVGSARVKIWIFPLARKLETENGSELKVTRTPRLGLLIIEPRDDRWNIVEIFRPNNQRNYRRDRDFEMTFRWSYFRFQFLPVKYKYSSCAIKSWKLSIIIAIRILFHLSNPIKLFFLLPPPSPLPPSLPDLPPRRSKVARGNPYVNLPVYRYGHADEPIIMIFEKRALCPAGGDNDMALVLAW